MAKRSQSHYLDIGVLGEDFVTQWLRSTGWVILARRWHCRWGEIDIIARLVASADTATPCLAFVEVKTRSAGSWDAGGRLSITRQKQAKLWQTAKCFLASHPNLAEDQCRFDVALVAYRWHTESSAASITVKPIHPVPTDYQLLLQEYIPSAFEYGSEGF